MMSLTAADDDKFILKNLCPISTNRFMTVVPHFPLAPGRRFQLVRSRVAVLCHNDLARAARGAHHASLISISNDERLVLQTGPCCYVPHRQLPSALSLSPSLQRRMSSERRRPQHYPSRKNVTLSWWNRWSSDWQKEFPPQKMIIMVKTRYLRCWPTWIVLWFSIFILVVLFVFFEVVSFSFLCFCVFEKNGQL